MAELADLIAEFEDANDVQTDTDAQMQEQYRQSISLKDRFLQNMEDGRRRSTILGAVRSNSPAFDNEDHLVEQAERAYDAMPQWETPWEGLAALGGQLAAQVTAIENYTPLGLGDKLIKGSRFAIQAPVRARAAAGAIDAGVSNVAIDAATQGVEIAGGKREGFDPAQLALSTGLGAVVGGAAGAVTRGAPDIVDDVSPEAVPQLPAPPPQLLLPAPEKSLGEVLDETARTVRELPPRQKQEWDVNKALEEQKIALAELDGYRRTAIAVENSELRQRLADLEIVSQKTVDVSDVGANRQHHAQVAEVQERLMRLAVKKPDDYYSDISISVGDKVKSDRVRGLLGEISNLIRNEEPAALAGRGWGVRGQVPDLGVVQNRKAEILDELEKHPEWFKDADDLLAAPQPSATRTGALKRDEAGVAATQSADLPQEFKRLKDVTDRLADELDAVAVRQGRISVKPGGKTGAGQYSGRSGVIRIAKQDDFDVFVHELGHHLEVSIDKPVKALMQTHSAELVPMAYAGAKKGSELKEGFAEFTRLYVTNPLYARKQAPQFAVAFEAMLAKDHGGIAAALNDAAVAWRAWLDQPSQQAVASTIVSAKRPTRSAEFKKQWKKQGLWNTIAERLDGAYGALLDDLHPINRAVSDLVAIHKDNTGKTLDLKVTENSYKLARMSRGARAAGHMDIMHGVTPYRAVDPASASLRDAIITAMGKPNMFSTWDDVSVRRFGAYLWSRRALGEWDRFDQGLIPNPPDKLTRGDHAVNIKELDEQFPQFAKAASMVHDFARALWGKKRDAGLITEQQYLDGLAIKDYVPGNRAFDYMGDAVGASGGNAGKSGDALKSGSVKRFKGSTRDVINPLEMLMIDAYETASAIARNDVVKTLDRLAQMAGPGGGAIAERIPSHQMTATMVDPLEAVTKAAKASGLPQADIVVLRDAMEAAVGDEKAAIFRPAVINEKGEAIAFFREAGELRALRLTDGEFGKQMYQALTGMSRREQNVFVNLLAKPAQILRMGITALLDFILANLIRDTVGAFVFYGKPLSRLSKTVGGFADEVAGREAARRYSAMSGIMGGAQAAGWREAALNTDLKALTRKGWAAQRLTSFQGLMEATEISETATRLGLFKTFTEEAKARGLSDFEAMMEASWRARDHIDFDRRGSVMAGLSRIIPFLNASLQGSDKFVRQMVAPIFTGGGDAAARSNAVKAWARLSAITVMGVGLHALMSRHDEYRDLSVQTRANHWAIKWGDKWLFVPKPFEMAAFINAGEAAYDALAMRDPRWADQYLTGLLEVATPPNIMEGNPTIASAFEIASGNSLRTGQAIVPDELKPLEPWLQYTAKTAQFARDMGEATGQSPLWIEHVVLGHTGSLGRGLSSMYDYALSDKPTPGWDDMFFTRRFIKDASRGASSSKAFWQLISTRSGKMEGHRKSWQAMMEQGDTVRASDYLATLDERSRAYVTVSTLPADVKRLHPFERAKLAVTALNGLRRDMVATKVGKGDQAVEVAAPERAAADDILEDMAALEARNALVLMREPGWSGRDIIDPSTYWRELQAASPKLAEVLANRLATAKVSPFEAVADQWPELERRLLQDGSLARTTDLVAKVKAKGFEGRGKPLKKTKAAKPQVILE